uniref:YEATS domain-containing protein 4 n=1 Tax=Plectus sambesii TaxID=2011161 RepID=A0A914VCC3_9BILA
MMASPATPTSASSATDAASADGRCKGIVVVRPVVYGNSAIPFGKKRDEDGHTHEWTIYFRPYNNEDASKWIRKVQFKLHDSYANSTRVCEKPPYEVTETGWGEFEITIRVFFTDPNEKPVSIYHYLRLFQPQVPLGNGKFKVVCEAYDEIIFQDPSSYLLKMLKAAELSMKKQDYKRFQTDFLQKRKRTHELILEGRAEIRTEIDDLRESLKEADRLMQKYREEVEKAETTPAPSDPSTPAAVQFEF